MKSAGFKMLVLVLFIQLFGPAHLFSAGPEKDRTPIEITSLSMVAENKNNKITFTGSVVAQKNDITLYSDKMIVLYNGDQEIEEISAYGNVRLVRDDKEITADNAVYYTNDEKVIFTGRPVFREAHNIVSGTQITYFIPGERSIVENSRVILK